MTTPDTAAKTSQSPGRFQLPYPPERDPDEVTQFDHLFRAGNSHYLAMHLGSPESTLVEADRWIVPDASFNKARARLPDLLVAFNVDPEVYKANNGYIISEQGKPPDFVIEVASASTADNDVGPKRREYADLGIPEYWRFDETGRLYGAKLAGDRLENGEYVALPIEELPDGRVQGFSSALNLLLRWEQGELLFIDPATEQRIATWEDERARANSAEARAASAEARAASAEARVRELEDLLGRQDS